MDWHTEIRVELARHGRRVDDDVVEEMAQHAESAWHAARAEGTAKEAATARVRALIAAWCQSTGGPHRGRRPALLESAPASRSVFAGIGLDLRYGWRVLRRQPGFALVSVLMIALGTGVTSTIFSVVNGVLLKPLPWPSASSLVRVSETRRGGTVNTRPVLSNATYLAWVEHATTIDALAGYSETTVTLETEAGAERVGAARVTASLFPMLGVTPLVGPGFSAAEEERALVVLSYGFWQERFGGVSDVVGQTLRLARRRHPAVAGHGRGSEAASRAGGIHPGSQHHHVSLRAGRTARKGWGASG